MEVGFGPRVPTAKSERLVSVQSRDLRREPGQRARRAGTGRSPPELMRHLSHSPSGISEPRMAIGCRRRAGRAEPPGEGSYPRGAACHSRKRALFAIIVEAQRRTEGEPRTHLIRNHNQPAPRLYSDSSKKRSSRGPTYGPKLPGPSSGSLAQKWPALGTTIFRAKKPACFNASRNFSDWLPGSTISSS